MVSTACIDQHLLRPRVLQLYTRCPFEPAQCNCAFHCVFMYQSECSVTFMKLLFYCIHIWAFWKVQECFSNWLLANLGEIWATANLMEQLWIPQQFIWWLILQFQHSEGWNMSQSLAEQRWSVSGWQTSLICAFLISSLIIKLQTTVLLFWIHSVVRSRRLTSS